MVDALIFGPHPDDIEILAGGLVLSLRDRGYSVGGIDMTAGEAGTRGSPTLRAEEARRGAGLLGLVFRECLGLPDGGVENTRQARDQVIGVIRHHRPRLVVGPIPTDHHPDHSRTGQILKEARFLAGCARIGPGGEPWRPGRVLFYPGREPILPSLVVDITAYFDRKLEALRAHRSQLHDPLSTEPPTTVAAPDFLEYVTARARTFGAMIGVRYGEPFIVEGPLAVLDPMTVVEDRGHRVFMPERLPESRVP